MLQTDPSSSAAGAALQKKAELDAVAPSKNAKQQLLDDADEESLGSEDTEDEEDDYEVNELGARLLCSGGGLALIDTRLLTPALPVITFRLVSQEEEGDESGSESEEEELGTAALLGPPIADDPNDNDFVHDPDQDGDDDHVIYDDEDGEAGGEEPSSKKSKTEEVE